MKQISLERKEFNEKKHILIIHKLLMIYIKINNIYNLSHTTNKIIRLKIKLRSKLHANISRITVKQIIKITRRNINSSGTKFHRIVKMSMFRAYARFPGMGALPQSVPQLTRIEFSRLNDTAPKDFTGFVELAYLSILFAFCPAFWTPSLLPSSPRRNSLRAYRVFQI